MEHEHGADCSEKAISLLNDFQEAPAQFIYVAASTSSIINVGPNETFDSMKDMMVAVSVAGHDVNMELFDVTNFGIAISEIPAFMSMLMGHYEWAVNNYAKQ